MAKNYQISGPATECMRIFSGQRSNDARLIRLLGAQDAAYVKKSVEIFKLKFDIISKARNLRSFSMKYPRQKQQIVPIKEYSYLAPRAVQRTECCATLSIYMQKADSLQTRALCSNRVWISGKQLTGKSRISKQLSRQHTLCLRGSYSTKHGD